MDMRNFETVPLEDERPGQGHDAPEIRPDDLLEITPLGRELLEQARGWREDEVA